MDEAMIYNSVPRVVWVMFAWSLVGAGIALVTLHLVNASQWAWKKWCVTPEPPHDLLDRWWENEISEVRSLSVGISSNFDGCSIWIPMIYL